MQDMDLNEIVVFVRVAQTGSFTAAARQLGMPNSTVSARVSSLEKRLGATLIQRTTRKLHLTPQGREYYLRCLQGLSDIQAAESEVSAAQSEPQGLLRVTAPAIVGSSLLPDIITEFLQTYPKMDIELILSDRVVDLITEGVDLAIRGGDLKDSSLIMKKIGGSYFAPFASPSYIKKHGSPAHPKDLRDHRCLQFTPLGKDRWEFTNQKTRVSVSLPGKIIIDDLNMIKALAMKDAGIALLPTFLCGTEAKNKKLLRVLPTWVSNTRPLNFVYPAQRFVSRKLQAFMDLAMEPLKKQVRDLEL